MKKKIFILALIAALGVAALAYYQYQRPVSSISGEEPQATFTSEALFDYFTEHETIATKDLNGKIVQVSGTVVEVLANSDSSTTVVLGSEHPVFGVKCRFEPGSLNDIKPMSGEQIEIKGICTGMTADVEMNQCVYLKK
jgi:hypothetical protein